MKDIGEILEYIEDNGVKFVKLSFCDILGRHKNVSVNASHFGEAAEGFVIDPLPFGQECGDLLLLPRPETFTPMPWRPAAGAVVSVMCRILRADGKPFGCDCGTILEDADKRFTERTGCFVRFMTESEFYIFRLDENGDPMLVPVDSAGYLDAAPRDRCENLRRDIVFNLETMGMQPLSSHHEKGKGQNAVIFRACAPYMSAVNTVLFRSAVRNIAYANGLYASFAPCPMDGEIGSNFRVVARISRAGKQADIKDAEAFARGIRAHMHEMAAFTNPVGNSYDRLALPSAPCGNGSDDRRDAVIVHGDGNVEIMFADTACNPFTALSLMLAAGADGMSGAKLPAPLPMPASLGAALDIAENSEFVARNLPDEYLKSYFAYKRRLAARTGREDVLAAGY